VNGLAVYSVQVTRGNTGQVNQKTETANGATHMFDYSYDLDGQLMEVKRDNVVVETYGYDANGNRTSSSAGSASFDTLDRLSSLNGTTYVFDVDGFLASRGSDQFVYSARGELLEATLSGGTVVDYAYDGLGRRVARSVSAGTEQYLYGNPGNPFQITAARDSAGVLSEYFYDDAGMLYAFERGGSRFYVVSDPVGTPRVVCDAAGSVVKMREYDSFGVLLSDSDPSFYLPFGYAGGLDDKDTGLVRFGLRDYDPAEGRWTARDPLLFGGGQGNLYVYVANDPVNLVDPTGLFCIGGSSYAGVGAGFQVCVSDQGLSVCAEVGFGAGGGLNVDPFSGLTRDGQYLDVAANLGAGPLGAGLNFTLDDCGNAKLTPQCNAGPFGCTGKVGGKADKLSTAVSDLFKSTDFKLQGKIAGRVCRSAAF